MKLRLLAQRCKHLAPLLAAPAALLLSQGQAMAVLNVNIFDDGPNLKVTVKGSISPGPNPLTATCSSDGVLFGEFSALGSAICSGPTSTSSSILGYSITGPTGFGGTGSLDPANTIAGYAFIMAASSYSAYPSFIGLDSLYSQGDPFFSGATFNDKSLASEGFTASGFVGTWTIDGTTESINVFIGPEAPGPLPLFGAGAAFGWSRKLRRRIGAASSSKSEG